MLRWRNYLKNKYVRETQIKFVLFLVKIWSRTAKCKDNINAVPAFFTFWQSQKNFVMDERIYVHSTNEHLSRILSVPAYETPRYEDLADPGDRAGMCLEIWGNGRKIGVKTAGAHKCLIADEAFSYMLKVDPGLFEWMKVAVLQEETRRAREQARNGLLKKKSA